MQDYATEGLRTLCIAMREIPEEEYQQWSAIYNKAAATINGRQEELDKAAELIETNLFLLGATAIEDKLQDGVPEAIATLQQAGIKVWVLTGDRQETAINIGLSCRLISESMSLVIVNEETMHDTKSYITKKLEQIKAQKSTGDLEELALVIDGKSLTYALEKEISGLFLELAVMCKAVVCCKLIIAVSTRVQLSPCFYRPSLASAESLGCQARQEEHEVNPVGDRRRSK